MKAFTLLVLAGVTAGDFVGHSHNQLARGGRQQSAPAAVSGGIDFSGCVQDADTGLCCVETEETVQTLQKDPILECTHKNTEQCHYTYVTKFQPSQEEVCDETFEKSCQITFKQQAYNETVNKCYKPVEKECNGQGEEVCKTVYESACSTKYVEKQLPAKARARLPAEVQAKLLNLDGREFAALENHQTLEHHVNIMPTSFRAGGPFSSPIETYQFTSTSHSRTKDALPSLIVSYEVSPIQVRITATHQPLSEFLINLCAIVGGAFAIFGILDAVVFESGNIVKKKMGIGKQF